MTEQILYFIGGLSSVMAIGQYLWTRHKIRREIDESFDHTSLLMPMFLSGPRGVYKVTCGLSHPKTDIVCQLDPNHVGVHECRGNRWYGDVIFPKPGKTLADVPKHNPYIPPGKEHAR